MINIEKEYLYHANEQITNKFEHLLNLRSKYDSIDRLRPSSRQSRIVYRINKEKLDKYRSQFHTNYDSEHLEEKKKTNDIPMIQILSEKVSNQKAMGTQTTFSKQIDSSTESIQYSINTLAIIPKVTSDQPNEEGETELLNTFSSSSSSRKTATRNLISPSAELDLYPEISMTSESNQMQNYEFNSYSSKPQSTNRRLYIRSIVRHMLSDDTSDQERY